MKNPLLRQRTPGHYASLLNGNDSAAMIKAVAVPGNRGVLKRYVWNTLEPVKGQYNFAEIVADLAFCATLGIKLVAMIVDKSFTNGQSVMPKGMEAYEAPNLPVGSQNGGMTALRWNPAVITQFNALTAALGAAFNSNESFEGIATVETSTSMSASVMAQHGYTPELYRDAYINILTTAAKNMPNSQVFWFQNFFPGNQSYIAVIAAAVKPYGVSVAGPDCLPTNVQLVSSVYPLYSAVRGQMNLGIQMSAPGYAQEDSAAGRFYSMTEMFQYARDVLYSDYIFWMPIPKPADPSKGWGWADAVAVIASNPTFNF